MSTGQVTANVSLVSVLIAQTVFSNRPILATVTNLIVSHLCLNSYLNAIKNKEEKSSPGVDLTHASAFGILTLVSGWRTLGNVYSAFEFGDFSNLIKGVGQGLLTLTCGADAAAAALAPRRVEEESKSLFERWFF